MPEEQHLVLNLHLVDGFSHKEIGDMIGITSEVSRQRLSRARKWVRDRFDLAGNELVSKTQQER
jgi:RNA polymerase sigma-70 factor (ECF subfamily)